MQEATVAVKTPPMPDSVPPTHDMVVGNHVELDFSTFFTDEDGDELTYMAVTSDAAVATASVDGSVVTTTAADEIEDSVGTVVTLTVTATDPGGLSAEQEAMVRVNAMAYDTLVGITVDSVGGGGCAGNRRSTLNQLPRPGYWPPLGRESVYHHSLVGMAAGGGYRVGHRAGNLQRWHTGDGLHHLPRRAQTGGPPGRHLQTDRKYDDPDRHGHHGHRTPTYEDTVTATFRSPTFNNKPGGSPAQDASFSSLRSGPLDAAQPSRASLRSLALPGPRFRPPPAAEARAASRVAQVRASAHATLRPPAFTRSRGIAYRQRPSPGNLRKPT